MKRIFVELPMFHSKWKSLGLNDEDLKRLQEEILSDPKSVLSCKVPVASAK